MSKNTQLGNLVNGIYVDSTGRVGIGTQSPSQLLEVNNATSSIIKNVSGTRALTLESYSTDWSYLVSAGSNLGINVGGANALVINVNSAERMRIASDGTKYLGTFNSSRLQISSSGESMYQYTNNYYIWGIFNDSNSLSIESAFGGNIIFRAQAQSTSSSPTTATERMRITSGGNVLIGTTTDNGYKVNVSGNIFASSNIYALGGIGSQSNITIDYGYVLAINSNTQASSNCWYMQVSSSFSNYFRFFYGGTGIGYGSARAQIDTNGTYTALSDANKKKDVAITTFGLAEINQLKPSTFKFIDDESQEEQIGFIAQEVKDIIPHAYFEDISGDDKFIGLKYNAIIPVLVKAIQELSAEVQLLKNK